MYATSSLNGKRFEINIALNLKETSIQRENGPQTGNDS